jgi:hypothetical protein
MMSDELSDVEIEAATVDTACSSPQVAGNPPRVAAPRLGAYDPAHVRAIVPVEQGGGLVMGATAPTLLRSFANGGSSLTGVEAISNTVDVFRKLQGVNACRVLTAVATMFGLSLAGVAYLACVTHATGRITWSRTRGGRRI